LEVKMTPHDSKRRTADTHRPGQKDTASAEEKKTRSGIADGGAAPEQESSAHHDEGHEGAEESQVQPLKPGWAEKELDDDR
jgi:hypothetical protein